MTTPVVNPKTGFTISQGTSTFVAEGVTGATVAYGQTSGGPYPNVDVIPAALVSADEASGNIVVALPAGLAFGTYYAVATVSNAAGNSLTSNEAAWTLAPTTVPTAPTLSIS